MIFILAIIVLLLICRRNKPETFITEKNKEQIFKMNDVYKKFLVTNPTFHIIETLHATDDVFTVLVYDELRNISMIFRLTEHLKLKIGDPFLLNEYDSDLNVLDKSKMLTTLKEYKLNY